MIYPQSLTLREAYDPYLVAERLMFLDGSLDDPLLKHTPSANDPHWIWAFDFDHENTLIHVVVTSYCTLQDAREALENILWMNNKIVKCGGITDMVSEEGFSSFVPKWSDSAFRGVNS